jgi:GntR family transcriptional regulator/MocR family aminotransferase
MHLVVHLPDGTDDLDVVARCQAHGLTPTPLSVCGVERSHAPGLLIGFANVAVDNAAREAERLRQVLAG